LLHQEQAKGPGVAPANKARIVDANTIGIATHEIRKRGSFAKSMEVQDLARSEEVVEATNVRRKLFRQSILAQAALGVRLSGPSRDSPDVRLARLGAVTYFA